MWRDSQPLEHVFAKKHTSKHNPALTPAGPGIIQHWLGLTLHAHNLMHGAMIAISGI